MAFCLTAIFAVNEEAETPNVTLVIRYSFKGSFGRERHTNLCRSLSDSDSSTARYILETSAVSAT